MTLASRAPLVFLTILNKYTDKNSFMAGRRLGCACDESPYAAGRLDMASE